MSESETATNRTQFRNKRKKTKFQIDEKGYSAGGHSKQPMNENKSEVETNINETVALQPIKLAYK